MPNYHQFLRTRRSVRRFLDRPVPDDVLHRILETATYAPSAHHRQHWRFVVLQKQASKERLAHHMGAAFRRDLEADGLHPQKVDELVGRSRQRILSAPLAVVLCFDPTVGDDYPDETRQRAEYMMGVQSAALSGLQFLLAAHAEGMEGVWTCGPLFAPEPVRQALDLPSNWVPQALFFLGYPVKVPEARPRKPVEEIAIFI